jgi:CheY-like chemotaxis protein
MAPLRILVVDDQREIRRLVVDSLKTLRAEIEVVEMPSAEEALLESSRKLVDLIISDVRLPGISGLDLVTRIQKRNPNMKIILLTGISDPKVRKQVEAAGADAFFYKPVEIGEFLGAVERCLGLAEGGYVQPPASPKPAVEKEPAKAAGPAEKTTFKAALPTREVKPEKPAAKRPTSLGECLEFLHQEAGAAAVALVDERSRVIAETGELPDAFVKTFYETVLPEVMLALASHGKATYALGMKSPEDFLCLRGVGYSLCVSHVGISYVVLVFIRGMAPIDQLASLGQVLVSAGQSLLEFLTPPEGTIPTATGPLPELAAAAEPINAEELEAFSALFRSAPATLQTTDVDAFWDTILEQSDPNDIGNKETIDFEQARRLGLTPGTDELRASKKTREEGS